MKEIRNTSGQAYDIIGDIHGHADELHALLTSLGYLMSGDTCHHPAGRKVIFLGDYIDRGPKIREVLEIVRGMVDAGTALAILGNHEVNAMRMHALGSNGQPLRQRSPKNLRQQQATEDQFPNREEWAGWIRWFAGLPLSLDLGDLRAVHAAWDDEAIRAMIGIGRLEGATLEKHSRNGTPGYELISRIVNGPEAMLPEGFQHKTADGTMRKEFRVKWWLDLSGLSSREAIFPDDPEIPGLPPRNVPRTGYSEEAPPTFFGHYALKDSKPSRIRPNLACLDYGTGKGGFLCAYRWDGERQIDDRKFVTVGATGHPAEKSTKVQKNSFPEAIPAGIG